MVCLNGFESIRKGRRDYTLYSLVRAALLSDSPMTLQVVRPVTGPCLMSHNPALTQPVLKVSFLASSSSLIFLFLFFLVRLYFQCFPHWCVAAKYRSDLRLLLHPFFALFCLADKHKVYPCFPSPPQFCPILTAFP